MKIFTETKTTTGAKLSAVLFLVFLLGLAVVFLEASAKATEQEQEAKYELAMFAEEWNLDWTAGQYMVGTPWTVGLVHFDKKTGATVIWEEADFCSLPRAVELIEQHFTEHQAEGFSESNLESRCK